MTRAHEAEYAVLGALLCNGANYWLIADLITPADFADDRHARLFELIGDLVKAGKPADPMGVHDAEPSLYAYADACGRDCYNPASVVSYAESVRARAEARRLKAAGLRIAQCEDYDAAQAILADVRPAQARKLKTATDGLREMVEALQRRYDADGSVSGVPTSLASLDALTAGWQPGNLIILAARPGMGKSALALQCALAAGRCLYSSLEMTAGELVERAVANVGNLPHRWIRFPLDAPDYAGAQVTEASKAVATFPLLLDDSPGLSADAIFSRMRQAHMAEPLRLGIVDHLGLIRRPGKHDPSELGQITAQGKQLAKELNIPLIVLCQLNRGLESRSDRRPTLADLRDSGRIEEDADVVIGLYRDEYYNPDKTAPLAGYCEAIVLKNRSGEKGTAWSRSRLANMRLESCDEPAERPDSGAGRAARHAGFQARSPARREPATVSGNRGSD